MENLITHTKHLLANLEQAQLNQRTGNLDLMLQDLNMAALLADNIHIEIGEAERLTEARRYAKLEQMTTQHLEASPCSNAQLSNR